MGTKIKVGKQTDGDANEVEIDVEELLNSLQQGQGDEDDTDNDDDEGQEDSNEDTDGDDDADDEDSDDEGSNDNQMDSIVAKVVARLEKQFDSVADRRVNAILKEVRKGKEPKQRLPKKDGKTTDQSESVDLRAARLTFKEYLTDDFEFIGADERKFAMTMGRSMIGERAAGFDDEDELGREVASDVTTLVEGMRDYYQKQTVEALRRQGAFKRTKGQPGRTPKTGKARSDWAKGADVAKARHNIES